MEEYLLFLNDCGDNGKNVRKPTPKTVSSFHSDPESSTSDLKQVTSDTNGPVQERC